MRSLIALTSFLLTLACSHATGIMDRKSSLYADISPKLRIQTTEPLFAGVLEGDVSMEFVPPIPAKDYTLVIASDDVISVMLDVKNGKKWGKTSSTDATTLFLTSLKVRGAEKLDNLAPVATVLPTPTITPSSDVVYMTATRALLINGTGFREKNFDMRFDPPLQKDVDYILTVRSDTQLLLVRKSSSSWRTDNQPGPLKLQYINTGAGFLRVDPKFGGVTVAEVQVDLGAHGVTVVDTPDERSYQSSGRISILGTGFNSTSNTLRFSNGLRGRGTNYTAIKHTENELVLELSKGSRWRANPTNLPGPLTLLAVDAGAGFVAVGPTEAKKGRNVATIFEDPSITSPPTTIYNMHTHEVWVRGTGFTRGAYTTTLTFDPALKDGEDIDVKVYNRTTLRLKLRDGKSWSTFGSGLREKVPLKLVSINTGAGTLLMDKLLGTIQEDEEQHASIRVDRSSQLMYQSTQSRPLIVTGSGFTRDTSIHFSPYLEEGVDYSQTFVSQNEINLLLKPSQTWHYLGGTLFVTGLTVGGTEVPVGSGGQGLQVAEILLDPFVEQSERIMFASHTPRLTIRGDGFDVEDTFIELSPTPSYAYEIDTVEPNEMILRLNPGYSWVEDLQEGQSKHVRVLSLDTGAGPVFMSGGGVVVAKVEPDIDDNNCDDSCEWALDGVCDDGTVDTQSFFDDDYGGFYGDDYEDDYGGYAYFDDDAEYADEDDDFALGAVCDIGTDCTDCGGPTHPSYDAWSATGTDGISTECDNSCRWANDGFCDDPRGAGLCQLGTDCADCGPVGESNFTSYEDDNWWDDEDDFYYLADDDLAYATPTLDASRLNDGAGGSFIAGMEAAVSIIGLLTCSAGAFVAYQWYQGKPLPFMRELKQAQDEAEMPFIPKTSTMIPITPDVTHTNE